MGILRRKPPDLEVPLEELAALAVKSFGEPNRDLELLKEVLDAVTSSPPEHVRSFIFTTLYACALFVDCVEDANPDLDGETLIDAIFGEVKKLTPEN